MIEGIVTPNGIAAVLLSIAGRDWLAMIDTGFNGDLELPEALRPVVNTRFNGESTSHLAAGQMVVEDSYIVDFPIDGQLMSAEATFVADDAILMGTNLLRHHRLEIDFPKRTVFSERSV